MTFADEHAPPAAPIGDGMPVGLRRAVLDYLKGAGYSNTDVWDRLSSYYGWADWKDAGSDFKARYGGSAAQPYYDTFHEVDRERGQVRFVPPNRAESLPALLAVPTPFFLTALELTLADLRDMAITQRVYFDPDPRDHINGVFTRRNVAYRLTDRDKVEWHGDAESYRTVIAPTRALLHHDSRFAGVQSEFEDALSKRRQATPKDLEDAIDEAAKSVESMMKVVLDANGIGRVGNETAEPLWNLLRDGDVVPKETKDAILATSRLRNVWSGHGTGSAPRVVPDGTPDLAIHSAASALVYLAGRMA